MSPAGVRTFVDRGGTFTDVVSMDDAGKVTVRKIRSDRAVVGDLAVGSLTFGTTVATNALLEGNAVRTLAVVTRGFRDLAWIRDQTRPELFEPDAAWPPPLCAEAAEVGGRLDVAGLELEPVPSADLVALEAAVDAGGFESVAVVLLNSHRNASQERLVAAAVRARRPDLYVVMGHEVSPELGYLARIETTLVDAAITPVLAAAMARDRIPAAARAIRSDGSLTEAARLRAPDAVLSGPAGGVLAVAAIAEQAGYAHVIGLDMGGTSTDVCRLDVGELPRREGDVTVAGVRLRRPMLEVETIAAGGGSIVTSDGLRLRVGPESAGADPGPACYGRGGPPTLTDAALLAGLVDPGAFDPPLDVSRVQLPGEPAEILAIGREAMAQAVRRLATRRGIDLTDHALVAYGGAAGQHAAAVAELLDVRVVLVHPYASVLSAWGQALARPEEAFVAPIWQELGSSWPAVEAAFARFEVRAGEQHRAGAEIHRSVELRYAGTDHGIEVPVRGQGYAAPLAARAALAAFVAAHRQRYGFDRVGGTVEVVNVRLRVRAAANAVPYVDDDPWGVADTVLMGPRRLDTPTTSVWVPAGWRASRHRGLLRLGRVAAAPPPMPLVRTPYAVELWSNRFQAVAEQAGTVLERLARSVNIRERRDFSCAVFDERGYLVANAPHIPVHLAAMGETVRDLIRTLPTLRAGQAYLTNDPEAGGSHLPDLTVVTPAQVGGRRFFVANRGHHVDVGGLTPGSMPPSSRTLADEGFVVRHLPLLTDGGALADVAPHLVGCRQPSVVLADLEAQVAANVHAARELKALGDPDVIATWMKHLRDVAEEAVARVIRQLRDGSAADTIGGVPLRVSLRVDRERLIVDFGGTGGPHDGNLNAPPAVVRAAVLYALRLLVDRPIPLNEGALSRVDIRTPSPSILAPERNAAVVGGNVETSQRLVDLVLRAAGRRAASQGTMNNLSLGGEGSGGEGWSLYETVGGGCGASPNGPGASARQVHMTNTRATDPEVMEARLPLRVRRFERRRGSGGQGAAAGGDGLVREIEVTQPGRAALLATRRTSGAQGLAGGASGRPGEDWLVRRDGTIIPWDGSVVSLEPGDRVRVETPGGGGWGQR